MTPGYDVRDVPERANWDTAETSEREAVGRELDRILRSASFRRSPRLGRFLRYAVERSLLGRQEELKEYTIAVDVFDRPPDFDPRQDTIVRTQARRLRQKLSEYYQTAGATAPVVIEIAKGSYAAEFHRRTSENGSPDSHAANGSEESVHRDAGARWMRPAGYAAVALSLLLLGLTFERYVLPAHPTGHRGLDLERLVRRYKLGFEQGVAFPVISGDGRHLLCLPLTSVGKRPLWIWSLDQWTPRVLEGTEGAWGYGLSPSGDRVAFATDEELYVIPTAGGPPRRICSTGGPVRGLRWNWAGDQIVFGGGPAGLCLVSAKGGVPEPVFTKETWEELVRLSGEDVVPEAATPYFLPTEDGGQVIVFTIGKNGSRMILAAHDLDRHKFKILGEGGLLPRYSNTGHLVYSRLPEVWARSFSLRELAFTGDPFLIADNAGSFGSVSLEGTLVYGELGRPMRKLVCRNRDGVKTGEVGRPHTGASTLSLSPTETHVSLYVHEDQRSPDLVVYSLQSEVASVMPGRLHNWMSSSTPLGVISHVWSPAGDELAFSSAGRLGYSIFRVRSDGGGDPIPLADSAPNQVRIVTDWSADGKNILYRSQGPTGTTDLDYLEQSQGGGWTTHSYIATSDNEDAGSFSPNGRFVAYVSQGELVVRPFPVAARSRWPVSKSGVAVRGRASRWTRGGSELVFTQPAASGRLAFVSAEVSLSGQQCLVGAQRTLFEVSETIGGWDVTNDGERFLISEPVGAGPKPEIVVVENWFEEFRDQRGH